MRSNLLALLVVFTLVAAACGGTSSDDDNAAPDDTEVQDNEGTGTDEEEEEDEPAGDPEPTAGFDGETITLGVITPTSGSVALIGNPLTNGNQAYFDYVNEELGGVAGKYPVELIVRDSNYDPTQAGQEYEAIKNDVVMFVQILGTHVVNSLLERLEDDEMVAAPASLDSFWVREPNLLPVGGPYQTQAMNALYWYVNDGDGEGKTVCSLIQDDPYGEAGQEGLQFAADNLGIDIALTATFPAPPAPQTPETFTAPIGQLQGAGCEMVYFVATPSSTGAALGLAASSGFAPQWIGQSPSWIGVLAHSELAPYLEANFLVASEGVNWGDTSVPGMAELMRIREEYAPEQEPDIYFNFGYLQAKATHALLEKAIEKGDLSHAGILDALENLGTVSFDQLTGDYVYGAAEDREPPRVSSVFKVDPESPTGLTLVEGGIEAPFVKDFEYQ